MRFKITVSFYNLPIGTINAVLQDSSQYSAVLVARVINQLAGAFSLLASSLLIYSIAYTAVLK